MKDKQNESGALFFSIGWMSSAYFLSDNTNEKQTIAELFKNIKQSYGIESDSLNLVIEDHYHGAEQI
jgi:hypothetical protein